MVSCLNYQIRRLHNPSDFRKLSLENTRNSKIVINMSAKSWNDKFPRKGIRRLCSLGSGTKYNCKTVLNAGHLKFSYRINFLMPNSQLSDFHPKKGLWKSISGCADKVYITGSKCFYKIIMIWKLSGKLTTNTNEISKKVAP